MSGENGPHGICPVCWENLTKDCRTSGDFYDIHCPRCGNFKITRTAASTFQESPILGEKGSRTRANLSSWLREKQPSEMLDSIFLQKVGGDNLSQEFWATREPTFHQKADKLLRLIQERTRYAGEPINWDKDAATFRARAWALNLDELVVLLDFLREEKRIMGGAEVQYMLSGELGYGSSEIVILPEGWAHLEKIAVEMPQTDQAFIAMWFDEQMNDAWASAFMPALGEAGYYPQKIDMKQHNNKIDDEIIAEIKRSKFLVADLTGHRGGVYFEAGFAKGLGLEVIWTCRENHFDDLHFDIRQYSCIKWQESDLEALRTALRNRIEATLGRGNYKPNPV